MKRTLLALFAAASIAAVAAPIDINGDFKKLNGTMPAEWQANKGDWNKARWGSEKLVKGSTGSINAFQVLPTDKVNMAFYMPKAIATKAGDKYVFSARVKGKGGAVLGFYLYDAKGYTTLVSKTFKVTGEWTEIKADLTIVDGKSKEGAVRTVKDMRPFFEAHTKSDVTFEGLTINKL